MQHKQPTLDALARWVGDKGWTHRTAALLRQSGFIDKPERYHYRWKPVAEEGIDGWDDGYNEMLINGDKCLKTVAHLGFSWLFYSLSHDPRKWVWFSGPHGVGKSHLACVIGAFWIKRMNRSGLYVQWGDYLDKMRHTYDLQNNGVPLSADLVGLGVQSLANAGILILDDVSSSKMSFTEWAIDQWWLALDRRIGKPTIIVSNLCLSKYVKRLQATGYDAAPKAADRLGQGKGGNVSAEIRFSSKNGSYRQKNGGVHA